MARSRLTRSVGVGAAFALAITISACGSSAKSNTSGSTSPSSTGSDTGSSASNTALASKYISQYFADSFSVSQLSPTVVDAFATAEKPLSASQQSLLFSCLSQETCDTGHGKYVLGFAETNDNNSLRQMFRLEMLAQAIATPEIKKVIYLDAGGSLSTYLSQLNSLISLGANIIMTESDKGAAEIPVLHQATQQGIDVVLTTELQGATAGSDYGQILEQEGDICSNWTKEAQIAISSLGQAKSYATYTGPAGNTYFAAWHPCVTKAFAGAGWKEAVTGNTSWTPQGEQQAATALIASGKSVDAVFYDYNLNSFLQAYLTANKTPPALFGSQGNVGLYTLYQSATASGKQLTIYVSPTTESGYFMRMGVTAGVEKLQGMNVPAQVTVPFVLKPVSDLIDTVHDLASYPAATGLPVDVPASWVQKALH